MDAKNRVKYRLKRVYYAPATIDESGDIAYAAPIRMKDAVSISLSPKGDLIVTYADAQEIILGRDNAGYDGEAEFLRIPECFEVDCLGSTKNEDGTIEENDVDTSKPFALLFEFEGDAKAIRHCMFLCYASKQTVDGSNSESKTPTNDKIVIKSRARADGKIKIKTGDTTDPQVYENWYNAVPDSASAASQTVDNGHTDSGTDGGTDGGDDTENTEE